MSLKTIEYYPVQVYQELDIKKTKVGSQFELLANQHGKSGFPKTKEEYLGAVVLPLQNSIQEIFDKNQEHFLPFTTIGYAQTIDNQARSQINKLVADKNDKEKKIDNLQIEAKGIKAHLTNHTTRKIIFLILCIVSIIEGYFSTTALRNILSAEVAWLMGLLIAFGTGFGSHFLAGWIIYSKNVIKFRIKYALGLLIASSIFIMLAILRTNGYNYVPEYLSTINNAVPVTGGVSAVPFALVSISIFWLCIFVSIKNYVTKSQRALDNKYIDLNKEINSNLREIVKIDKSITAIEKNALEQKLVAARSYEFASTIETSLRTFANKVLNNYKSVNFNYRPQSDYPGFFSENATFIFKSYFPPIQNHNNEKA